MQVSDVLVEVRRPDFTRSGQIGPGWLNLMVVERHNGVGSWKLKIPAEHPQLEELRAPGAGLIITMPGRVVSGRTRTATLSQDSADPTGTWVVEGWDDNVIASATLALPDPANPPEAQTQAYDEQRAAGESVMKHYVRYNAGDLAPPARDYPWLVVAPDQGRGAVTTGSARFTRLGELLSSLGTLSGLGWRFAQQDDVVEFEVYEPADKRGEIRMSIINGGLTKSEWGYSAPQATRVYVAGQGEGAERTILEATSAESLAAEAAWGLRWEIFKDQRNTDDPVALQEAGDEILAESGTVIRSLKVEPSDAPNMEYGKHWGLGDLVTIMVDGGETYAVVTQASFSISSAGVIVQATVGDPVGFDFESRMVAKVNQQDTRLSRLERTVGGGGGTVAPQWADILGKPLTFPPSAHTHDDRYYTEAEIDTKIAAAVAQAIAGARTPAGVTAWTAAASAPTGWLLLNGSTVAKATYPDLFEALGGEGSYPYGQTTTHFTLPNVKGRTIVGLDPSDTVFDARGETGGAKTVSLTAAQNGPHSHSIAGSDDYFMTTTRSSSPGKRVGSTWSSGAWVPAWTDPDVIESVTRTNADGSGSAHENLPPYIVFHPIIKT